MKTIRSSTELYGDLLSAFLAAEECNAFCAIKSRIARTSLEESVKETISRLRRSCEWSDQTLVLRRAKRLGLAKPASQAVLEYVETHLTRTRRERGGVSRSDWRRIHRIGQSIGLPLIRRDRIFFYDKGGGSLAFSTQELAGHIPVKERSEARHAFFEEVLDPFAIVADYLRLACGEKEEALNHLIQQWLTVSFGLQVEPRLRKLVVDISDYLNRAFYGSATPTRQDAHSSSVGVADAELLFGSIEEFLRLHPDSERRALGLWLFLRFARTFRRQFHWLSLEHNPWLAEVWPSASDALQEAITPARPCEASYLQGRIFGEITTLPGLNFIMKGAVVSRLDRGAVTMLAGAPGSGKTALALQLASDAAYRGHLAVYMSLEESYDNLAERLRTFRLLNENKYELRQLVSGDAEAMQRALMPSEARGVLVFCALPPETIQLTSLLKSLGKQSGWCRRKVLAIDSVNALLVETEPNDGRSPDYRHGIRDLIIAVEEAGFASYLLSEGAEADSNFAKLPYLVDTVMVLSRDEKRRRLIEVTKSRLQDAHAGRHVFVISEAKGIGIFPSLSSVRATLRLRRRTGLSGQRLIPLPRRMAEKWRVQGIKEKASVLLYGPSGAGKSSMALYLASEPAGLVVDGTSRPGVIEPRSVLIVTFGTPEHRYWDRLRQEPWRGRFDQIPATKVRWYSPGENFTGSQLVAELRRFVEQARREGLALDRLVFDQVDGAAASLPALNEDSLFWPTIMEVVGTEPITTIFVANTPQDVSDDTLNGLRTAVDYSFRFVPTPGAAEKPTSTVLLEKNEGAWCPNAEALGDWLTADGLWNDFE